MAEEKTPLDLLHEDEWLNVFKHLDDPRDLINISSADGVFEKMLQNNKVDGKVATVEILRLEEVVPLLLKWLSINDICNLCLASKRLSSRVDECLDKDNRIVPYENLKLYPRLMPPMTPPWPAQKTFEWRHFKLTSPLFKGIIFKMFEDLQKLKDDLNKGHVLIGKKVNIIMSQLQNSKEMMDFQTALKRKKYPAPDLPDAQMVPVGEVEHMRLVRFGRRYDLEHRRLAAVLEADFLEDTFQFFSRYPDCLRHLTLYTEFLETYPDVYEMFRRIIESLPKLNNVAMRNLRHSRDNQQQNHRQQFIPLPVHPSLEKIIVCYNAIMFPEVFVRQIAGQFGAHLRSLDISLVDDATFSELGGQLSWEEKALYGGEQPVDFGVLQYLKVRIPRGSILLLTRLNAPQLKILNLALVQGPQITPDVELETGGLIKALLSFPSIKTLIFSVTMRYSVNPRAVMEKLEGIERGNRHQNLKTLELNIRYLPFIVPLRFWTGLCPKLQEIQVIDYQLELEDDPRPPPENADKDLDLLQGGRFEESRIWEKSQNLDCIKLRHFSSVGENGRRQRPEFYECYRHQRSPPTKE